MEASFIVQNHKSAQPARTEWLAPLIVAVLTFVIFAPALPGDFLNWDDTGILAVPHYRGFGWDNLCWMFTTLYPADYMPLTWLSFATDYLFWGNNPFGYHLTNLVLHCLNAVIYFISRRLIALTLPVGGWKLNVGSVFAAAFFSLHPLRVESVAWIAERKDVLCGLFFLATIYFYLRAQPETASRRRWMVVSVGSCLLALLAKGSAIVIPLALLVLDYYPLKRQRFWALVWKKAPFALVALLFGVLGLVAKYSEAAVEARLGIPMAVENFNVGWRASQVLYGLNFYLHKTILPFGLSPLYERKLNAAVPDGWMVAGGIATVLLTILFYRRREKCPGVWASWLWSCVALLPVLGFFQLGPHIVADRYSYLSCMGWVVLAGGALARLLESRPERWTRAKRRRRARNKAPHRRALYAGVAAVAVLATLATLTWKQTKFWRSTGSLFARVLMLDPNSRLAHESLHKLSLTGPQARAEVISIYRQAVSAWPEKATARVILAVLRDVQEELRGDGSSPEGETR